MKQLISALSPNGEVIITARDSKFELGDEITGRKIALGQMSVIEAHKLLLNRLPKTRDNSDITIEEVTKLGEKKILLPLYLRILSTKILKTIKLPEHIRRQEEIMSNPPPAYMIHILGEVKQGNRETRFANAYVVVESLKLIFEELQNETKISRLKGHNVIYQLFRSK